MEESADGAALLFSNVPKDVGLAELAKEISSTICKQNAIRSIKWLPSDLDAFKNAKVTLEEEKDANTLLATEQIFVGLGGKAQSIRITPFQLKLIQSDETCEHATISKSQANAAPERAEVDEKLKSQENGDKKFRALYPKLNDIGVQNNSSPLNSITIPVDANIAEYTQKCDVAKVLLRDRFEELADLRFVDDDKKPKMCFLVLTPIISKVGAVSKESFEVTCKRRWNIFETQFASRKHEASIRSLEKFKKAHKLHDSGFWHSKPPCHFKWNLDKDPGHVIVTGFNNAVAQMIHFIQKDSSVLDDKPKANARKTKEKSSTESSKIDKQVSSSSLAPYNYKMDKNIMEFLQKSASVVQLLENSLVDLADLKCDDKNGTQWLILSPNMTKKATATQEDFDSECEEKLHKCLNKIRSEPFQYPLDALKDYKDKNGYPDADFWPTGNPPCLLKWMLEKDPGQIIVTGYESEVKSVLKSLHILFPANLIPPNSEQGIVSNNDKKNQQSVGSKAISMKHQLRSFSTGDSACDSYNELSIDRGVQSDSNTNEAVRFQPSNNCSSATLPMATASAPTAQPRKMAPSKGVKPVPKKRATSFKISKSQKSSTKSATLPNEFLQGPRRSSLTSVDTRSSTLPHDFRPDFDFTKPRSLKDLLEEDNQELFRDLKNNCIVVRDVPKDSSCEELAFFFEQQEVSGGGIVKRICRLFDGHLIAFEDKNSVSAVLSKKKRKFKGSHLKVHFKKVPPFDNRLLVLENDTDTTTKMLEAIFVSFPMYITENFRPSKFLVIFKQDGVDIREVRRLAHKHFLKTERMLHSDYLLITNLSGITDEDLERAFEKKESNVTWVRRKPGDSSGVVCFSNFEDVEKLLNGAPIVVNDIQLDMSYYLPGYGALHPDQYALLQKRGKKDPVSFSTSSLTKDIQLKKFYHKFPVVKEVAELFDKCPSLPNVIISQLSEILTNTSLQVSIEESEVVFDFTPKIQQKKDFVDQNQYEKQCRQTVTSILEKFTTTKIYLTVETVERLRKRHKNEDQLFLIIDEPKKKLLINLEEGLGDAVHVKITGTADHIANFIEKMDKHLKVVSCSEAVLQNLIRCGIFDDTKKEYPTANILTCLERLETEKVYYFYIEGNSVKDIEKAKTYITERLTGLKLISKFGLSSVVEAFLWDCLRDPESIVEREINKALKHNCVRASFQLKEMTLYCTKESFHLWMNVFYSMIEQYQFLVNDDFKDIEKTPEWKRIKRSVKNSKCLSLNVQGGVLYLVGLNPKLSELGDRITDLLSKSIEKNEVVVLDKTRAEYIRVFATALGLGKYLKEGDMDTDDDGIKLVGKSRFLQETAAEMKKIAETLKIVTHTIPEAWKIKFLFSPAGDQYLETLQKSQQCLMLSDELKTHKNFEAFFGIDENLEKGSAGISSPPAPQVSDFPVVQLAGTNTIVQLVQGNIVRHRVDAIVNTSNQALEMRDGGVSGCILREGGYHIQHEMNACRRGFPHGMLPMGGAVTTNAGNLRSCNKIIHVAGPVWKRINHHQGVALLKQSVMSCLDEAVKCGADSIAIPAISCGVFGGDPDQSSQIIVETIEEYFQKYRNTTLIRIDLIELNNATFMTAMAKYLNRLGEKPEHFKIAGRKNNSTTASKSHQANISHQEVFPVEPFSTGSPPRFRVVVENDSLLTTEADVILNTVGLNFNYEGTELSKLISKKVGNEVVEQWKGNVNKISSGSHYKLYGCFGNLNCQAIAHLVLSRKATYEIDARSVAEDLFHVFQAVNKCFLQSIALPAIGTAGKYKMLPDDSAKMIETAIKKFEKTNPEYLKTIKIVVKDSKRLAPYRKLATSPAPKPPKRKAPKLPAPLYPSLPSSSSQSPSPHGDKVEHGVKESSKKNMLTLTLCATQKSIINETLSKMEEKLGKKFERRQIENVRHFSKDDLPENIKQIKSPDIQVKKKSSSSEATIVVSGLSEDVKIVSRMIVKFLQSKNYIR